MPCRKKVLSLALFIGIMSMVLSGCAVRGMAPEHDFGPEESVSAQDFCPEKESISAGDDVSSQDNVEQDYTDTFQENTDRDLAVADPSRSVVRISAGHMMGSGVIYRRTDGGVMILTAGHVLEEITAGDPVWVTFSDETSIMGTSFEIVSHGDLGYVLIEDEAVKDEDKYPAVTADRKRLSDMKEDEKLFARGYASGTFYTDREGILVSAWIYSQAFDRHLMMAKVEVEDGMSGGGLFDEEGFFLGLICGADEEGNAFAEPLNSILAFVP